MAVSNRNRLIEKYIQVVREDGLSTNKNVNIGTAGATSTATLSVGTGGINTTGSTTTVGLVNTGSTTGLTAPVVQSALVGATVVLTAAQSGGVFQNRSTSGSPSWTLPTCANGLEYTFTTANTTAGFTVTGAQVIHAKTTATGTAITTTTTLTNTQGTAVVGDAITIVGDGTAWWVTAQTGTFAAS
jgi:hypothetical protein